MKRSKELERLTGEIRSAQADVRAGSFEMGRRLKEVKQRRLYLAKARTWRDWVESEIGIHRVMADKLIELVKMFDRKAFVDLGVAKLTIIARAPVRDRAALISMASTMSLRELAQAMQAMLREPDAINAVVICVTFNGEDAHRIVQRATRLKLDPKAYILRTLRLKRKS